MVLTDAHLRLFNKVIFVFASLTGLTAGILAIALPPKDWVLIIAMLASFAFFATFLTVELVRSPVPSRTLMTALTFFAAGAFGTFLSALDTYLLDPTLPYTGFLQLSVASSALLCASGLLLLLEIFLHRPPPIVTTTLFFISLSVMALLAASVLAFKGKSLAGRITNLVAFSFLLVASLFNLM